jgi:hypothetical protein
MRALGIKLGLTAAIAILALPSVAAAERIVPPGNSAVNQYTETFPTAKGKARTKHRVKRQPAQILGSRNAHRLEAAGPQGQAVAEVVAATAPAPAPAGSDTAPAGSEEQAGGGARHAQEPAGSSGVGKAIAEATGSSDSGELGLLLPILILCAIAGSTAYFWQHNRRRAT